MGFFKFPKKGKKEKMHLDESLDVPPPLPSIKGSVVKPAFGKKLPKEEFPPFKFKGGKPIPVTGKKLPELPKEDPGLEVPGFPPLEEHHEFIPKPPVKKHIEMPSMKRDLMRHEVKHEEIIEKPIIEKEEEIFTREKITPPIRKKIMPLREVPIKKSIYVKLEVFKETWSSLSIIRNDLKKYDKVVFKLVKSEEDKNKKFGDWCRLMEGIQKKLIFIEKTLFEGD